MLSSPGSFQLSTTWPWVAVASRPLGFEGGSAACWDGVSAQTIELFAVVPAMPITSIRAIANIPVRIVVLINAFTFLAPYSLFDAPVGTLASSGLHFNG